MKPAFLTKLSSQIIAFLVICCLSGATYWYYQSQSYIFGNDAVPVSKITDIRVPQPSLKPEPVYICFNNPVANINKLQQDITENISMYPATKGKWTWSSDTCLSFQPEISLIPDTKYDVSPAPEIFSPNIKVSDKDFSFKSPAFQGRNTSYDFYENPQTGDKSVVAAFEFNYPLNP